VIRLIAQRLEYALHDDDDLTHKPTNKHKPTTANGFCFQLIDMETEQVVNGVNKTIPSDDYLFADEVSSLTWSCYEHAVDGSQCLNHCPVGTFRKLTNFIYMDVFGSLAKSLFVRDASDPSEFFLMFGDVLPQRPTASVGPLRMKFIVVNVIVVYGCGHKDPMYGVWVQDREKNWYQLVHECHPIYSDRWAATTHLIFPLHETTLGSFGRNHVALITNATVYNRCGEMSSLIEIPLNAEATKFFGDSLSSSSSRIDLSTPTSNDRFNLHGIVSMQIGSQKIDISIVVGISQYEMGLGGNEAEKGLWTKLSIGNVWYKLVAPSLPYSPLFQNTIETCIGIEKKLTPYETRSNYFRDSIQSVALARLVDMNGLDANFLIEGRQQPYLLKGYLIPPNKSNINPIPMTCVVDEYVVDLSSHKGKDKTNCRLFMSCAKASKWFQIDLEHFSHEVLANSNINNIPNLNYLQDLLASFQCNDVTDNDVWRRLDNFALFDVKGQFLSPISAFDSKRQIILRGELTNSDRKITTKLRVQMFVHSYSIDYGETIADPHRGLWFQDSSDQRVMWYKALRPRNDYIDSAFPSMNKIDKFLKIHGLLVFKDPTLCSRNPRTLALVYTKSIIDLFHWSDGDFDLSFVFENKAFVKANLQGCFDMKGSKAFFSSIEKLSCE
jgi:hypothetical protein